MDGQHHFASNCSSKLGRTTVRDRLLGARGWHVVRLPAPTRQAPANIAKQDGHHIAWLY